MFDQFIGMKTNIFGSPFPSASCSSGEVTAVPRSSMMAAAEGYSCEFGSATYYAYCGFGGILSCGITHTAVVPLDLVKCRIQVDPGKYKGIFQAGGLTIKEEGVRGLSKVKSINLRPNIQPKVHWAGSYLPGRFCLLSISHQCQFIISFFSSRAPEEAIGWVNARMRG